MKVAMCVSEAVPFAKTGGLADVAGALPQALKKINVDSIVVMPGYGFIFEKKYDLKKISENMVVELNSSTRESFDLYTTTYNDVDFYFIKNDNFFNRENLYGTPQGDYADNNIRFGFFSKAVFKVLEKISFIPDIIHLHDYHFALVSVFLRDMQVKNLKSPFLKTRVVFTIHNIAYQGIYDKDTLVKCGIGSEYFNIDGLEFFGKVNFMKAGIVYSDKITTVSPTYAKEILTGQYGYGLEGFLKSRQENLLGIINGIDYDVWNPASDPNISKNYDISDLGGKQTCKKTLINNLFHPERFEDKPLLGMVSRLSEQKGLDLIVDAMDSIMQNDLYLVILGTGDEKYHHLLQKLAEKYRLRFKLAIGYSDKMSREIYSGADIFLMPSNYEPCGLGQLISLKYGTIPVVRNTGGLADTIIDIISANDIENGGQGFKFNNYSTDKFYSALMRAVDFYKDKKLWNRIIINGMSCNFSWEYSAEKYRELYENLSGKEQFI